MVISHYLLDAPSWVGVHSLARCVYVNFPALYYTIGMIGLSEDTHERTSQSLPFLILVYVNIRVVVGPDLDDMGKGMQ
jgi:hypothetical protein